MFGPILGRATIWAFEEQGVPMQPNLQPLIDLIQPFWTDQHAGCQPLVPQPHPGLEGLEFLWGYNAPAVALGIAPICGLGCGWRNGRTTDELVRVLRWRLKASAVEASAILEQPDSRLALQVASALVPQPLGDELTLVADLIEAAGAQTVRGRNRALAGAGIAAAGLLVYFGSRS